MQTRCYWFIGALLLALFVVATNAKGVPPSETARQPSKRRQIDETILSWLPVDTEGVILARGQIPLGVLWPDSWLADGSKTVQRDDLPTYEKVNGKWIARPAASSAETASPTNRQNDPAPSSQPSGERRPDSKFDYADLWVLANIGPLLNGSNAKEWRYRVAQRYFQDNIDAAVAAGRSGNAFGRRSWERCSIVKFQRDVNQQLEAATKVMSRREHKLGEIAVYELSVGAVQQNSAATLEYVCFPQTAVMISSNDMNFLLSLLERMAQPPTDRAFPDDLAEWQHVNAMADVWGLRHYRAESFRSDPTSMLQFDNKSRGIVLSYSQLPSPRVCIRYISTSERAEDQFREMVNGWLGRRAADWLTLQRRPDSQLEIVFDVGEKENLARPNAIVLSSGQIEIASVFQPLLCVGGAFPFLRP